MNESKVKVMHEGGKILSAIFVELTEALVPEITTKHIEDVTTALLLKYGVISGTKNLNGFPAIICVSVNEELLGGVPGNKLLKSGDLVKLDLTINYKGVYLDKAITVGIGKLKFDKHYIIKAANFCLNSAIAICRPGIRNIDIGSAIQAAANFMGVRSIVEFGGHGIGLSPHEVPFIPNYGSYKKKTVMEEGMTFTIEPIVVYSKEMTQRNGHTITGDTLSAHVEETILLVKGGCEVLTR